MAKYQLIQIDESSWQIEEEQVRCFLLVGSKRALLIDSGLEIDNVREIVEEITPLPIILVNTHTDPDHINCNAQFEEVHMHPSEYSFYNLSQNRTEGLKALWDGQIIDLGNRTFEVILTPGHTPGSITLLDESKRMLIGGDGVQNGTIYLFGPQRDLVAYIHSLERLSKRMDSFDTVYPSHAQCPISSEIIPGLIAGAKRLLSGMLEGKPYFPDMPSVKIYDIGAAHMLYEQ